MLKIKQILFCNLLLNNFIKRLNIIIKTRAMTEILFSPRIIIKKTNIIIAIFFIASKAFAYQYQTITYPIANYYRSVIDTDNNQDKSKETTV